jgi:hypothetical protein
MAQWQAPSTNNEREPSDVGVKRNASVRPYIDADTGRIKWWTGQDSLPVGATPLFMTVRASDGRRVFSTDSVNEREPVLFGTSHILIR